MTVQLLLLGRMPKEALEEWAQGGVHGQAEEGRLERGIQTVNCTAIFLDLHIKLHRDLVARYRYE